MPDRVQQIQDELRSLTHLPWRFADPFETQSKDFHAVPKEPGAFLWMRRLEPGPSAEISRDVLLAGSTRNLRRRLYEFSSGRTANDVTLQRLFEVVIAPALRAEVLQDLVVNRRSLPIAQMWVRDHVVFAFAPLSDFSPELHDLEHFGRPPDTATVLADLAYGLVALLQPWFNTTPAWTALGDTWHECHDITLPILPPVPRPH
ncbi:MAG: hypothetical protein KDB02_08440 [Acidimicrobiales bacterium]|nr:hypothetical protein [Acidimicrobiales bacterium]